MPSFGVHSNRNLQSEVQNLCENGLVALIVGVSSPGQHGRKPLPFLDLLLLIRKTFLKLFQFQQDLCLLDDLLIFEDKKHELFGLFNFSQDVRKIFGERRLQEGLNDAVVLVHGADAALLEAIHELLDLKLRWQDEHELLEVKLLKVVAETLNDFIDKLLHIHPVLEEFELHHRSLDRDDTLLVQEPAELDLDLASSLPER